MLLFDNAVLKLAEEVANHRLFGALLELKAMKSL